MTAGVTRFPGLRRRSRRDPAAAGSGLSGFGFVPDGIEVAPRHLVVGGGVCRSFTIVGYPREVGHGWLTPLLTHPARLDVTVHLDPIPADIAAGRLRRQLARLESGRRADAAKGRLPDPDVDVAAEDARDLATRLARGDGRLFRVGLGLTVHAATLTDLDAACTRVRALCASLLLHPVPTSYRMLDGWTATLPLGINPVGIHRAMDTDALAAAFPFTAPDLSGPGGILYGLDLAGTGVVMWDRFTQDNHNAVVLARSGAGKSYFAKLEALRSLYTGVQVLVVDPEDEYTRLADAVGGVVLHLGAPGVQLNPFDLGPGDDAVTRRALFLHSFLTVLTGPMDPGATAALDRAVLATYRAVGITTDPRTHTRPAPTLPDLIRTLRADAASDSAAGQLAARLEPFTTGSYAGLFTGATTTTRPDAHLAVFSLRDVPDELKTAATMLTLDAIWAQVTDPRQRRPRMVVVDEAWLLMRDPAGATFLYRMAKAARKHWAGLTVVTQDAADLLGTDLGQAVVTNAATQILLRQAPQTIDALTDAFGLSDGERAFLLSARRGDGLLLAGPDTRVAFAAVASRSEHTLVTTNPADLTAQEDTDL